MKDIFGRTLVKSSRNWAHLDLPEDGYEWSQGDVWEVTEETPMIEQPLRFLIQLMPYQLASIHSMIEIEKYKCFLAGGSREYYTSAAKLSNDMGSGKSATVLGLIASSPVPHNGPHYPISVEHFSNATARQAGGVPCAIVTRRYTTVYRPALIFVGYGVLNQWVGEVCKFTGEAEWDRQARRFEGAGMRIFTVDGIAALKRFYELVHNSDINRYDAVIIKNKDITGQWEWRHGEIEETIIDRGARKIWNMIAVMCRNMCFTRLIADDFDTIGMPPIAGNINALMTWLVSSTQARIAGRTWTNCDHATVEALTHNNNIMFSQVMKNQVIHDLFNVHVSASYIKKYMSVGRPHYFYYKFANVAGRVLDLINCMAGDKVSAIMEALNGDAVGEAARLAGIEASDPNQIFKALLQQNYDRLAEAKVVLQHFAEYFDGLDIDSLPPFSENPDQDDTYTRKDVRTRRPIEWRYNGIRSMLKEEAEKWHSQFSECSGCLQKFKDSVRSNECTVCSCELDDPDENYAIMPCCNEVLHADCAVRGCSFQKVHTRDGVVVEGRCPFDKSHRVLFERMTYIKGGFDLSRIDEDRILERDIKENDYILVSPPEPKRKAKGPRTKYDALVEIVRGMTPEDQGEVILRIPSVMQGRKRLGDPEFLKRAGIRTDLEHIGVSEFVIDELMSRLFPEWLPRTLVFANFDETLRNCETRLTEEGIRWLRLGGTMDAMRQQVEAFWAGTIDVLTVNSTTHCSSLNLQCADNLVFLHQINDSHTMRQVIGRIQRAGRKHDARIHWLLFENEITSLDPYKVEEEEDVDEDNDEKKDEKEEPKKKAVTSESESDDEEDEEDEAPPKKKMAKKMAKKMPKK